jgi:hypothetical protein
VDNVDLEVAGTPVHNDVVETSLAFDQDTREDACGRFDVEPKGDDDMEDHKAFDNEDADP